MFGRLRWLTVVLPTALVGAIELLSDTLLDEWLPFPWDTLLVMAVVAVLAFWLSTVALRRIDALSGALAARNADLEEREASARALHRVSIATAAMADLDQILQAVVDQARTILRADVAVLLLATPDGSQELRAASAAAGVLRRAGDLPGEGMLRYAPEAVVQVRLEAALQRGGDTIGSLGVGCARPRGFDVDEVESLSSLANQASIAIENARLQERLRDLAVIAERERIAREMHDGLAQVLGYVNTKSQAVEHYLAAGRVDEARTQLAELSAAARSLYVDVREAILGLRSPISSEAGFIGAVEDYARAFRDASKLAVQVDASPAARDLPLRPEVAAQLFRIVQEALTNVRKHASAHRVQVGADVADGRLTVSVGDDGTGMRAAPAVTDPWPHYGLDAMRERAASIGGTIEWASRDGAGTVVRIIVPMAALSPAGAHPPEPPRGAEPVPAPTTATPTI